MPIGTFIDAVTGKTRAKQLKEIEDKVSGKPKPKAKAKKASTKKPKKKKKLGSY
tara:strand:- start:1546 stop:1707 length:162 start_codon:yes stop_codon:yes gene_type:complete